MQMKLFLKFKRKKMKRIKIGFNLKLERRPV